MENDLKTMSTKELTEAVSTLLERETRRKSQRQRRTRRATKRRREEMESNLASLAHSVRIIQWCVISISTVMALGLIILTLVVWRIGSEAERIKGEVQTIQLNIEREADAIRDKLTHPLQSLGGTIGRRLDAEISDIIKPDAK